MDQSDRSSLSRNRMSEPENYLYSSLFLEDVGPLFRTDPANIVSAYQVALGIADDVEDALGCLDGVSSTVLEKIAGGPFTSIARPLHTMGKAVEAINNGRTDYLTSEVSAAFCAIIYAGRQYCSAANRLRDQTL